MTSSDALAAALEALRHQQAETGTLSLEMLAPLDQFHVRGLDAIVDLLAVCPFKREDRILDIGCGLGGPARFLAREIGCKVTATDIDGRAIETATQLNQLSGMTEHVTFRNCAHTDLETGRFDGAWSIHVSQFVADKVGFFSGIADQLTHGASLVLFDPVRTGGTYGYPVPWASAEAGDFAVTLDEVTDALDQSGFTVTAHRSQREAALDWFEAQIAARKARPAPDPIGLEAFVGKELGLMSKNVRAGLQSGALDLVEIVAVKR